MPGQFALRQETAFPVAHGHAAPHRVEVGRAGRPVRSTRPPQAERVDPFVGAARACLPSGMDLARLVGGKPRLGLIAAAQQVGCRSNDDVAAGLKVPHDKPDRLIHERLAIGAVNPDGAAHGDPFLADPQVEHNRGAV